MSRVLRIAITILASVWIIGGDNYRSDARAAETASAQSLLFDAPYLAQLELPTALAYSYRHETADEKIFGKGFSDTVRIKIAKPGDATQLNLVSLEIFPERANASSGPTRICAAIRSS